jgi:hypothetical protein
LLYIFSLIQLLNSFLAAQDAGAVETWPRIGVVMLNERLEHVQGIDVDDTHVWVSSVDRATRKGWLRRFNLRTGEIVNKVDVTKGDQYHPGGIALDGESIWVPVAEYKASSSTNMQRRHKTTLELLGSFDVADHIGCVASFGKTLVGGNWDSRTLYWWTRAGRELRRVENRTGVAFQDLKPLPSRKALIGGGIREKKQGEVAVFDPLTGLAQQSWRAGKTERGVHFTNEGLAIRGGLLYLLPEDGDSRLFVLQFDGKFAKPVKRK